MAREGETMKKDSVGGRFRSLLRRREVIAMLGTAAMYRRAIASPEPTGGVRRVGTLAPSTEGVDDPALVSFRHQLAELGWKEGDNLHLDYQFFRTQEELISGAAALVASASDVIFAVSTQAMTALRGRTNSIPVVFVEVSDPVQLGIVASLARPGGSVTGFTTFEFSMGGKWLELLNDFAPEVDHAAAIFNPKTAAFEGYMETARSAAGSLQVDLSELRLQEDSDIGGLIGSYAREPHGGVIILPDPFTIIHRQAITDAAAKYRLPAVYWHQIFTDSNGLLSYGIDQNDEFVRAAAYVARILAGTKPAELPVQAPIKFNLVINLKAARAAGFAIPPKLLARVDKVIE
jgi:putative tryptophan/tyrosine transport system substrate-binding protein